MWSRLFVEGKTYVRTTILASFAAALLPRSIDTTTRNKKIKRTQKKEKGALRAKGKET